ncbi:MAG: ribosome maturation factor [Bacteroidetes bacterium]|nr:ribosome maturation factor [Bacteroidota bacterium]MDF1865468.1 ribosome maturation factor [Saprospiraceae bacterium]
MTEKFQEEGFQDCFLVEIKLSQHNKVEVFLECDSGLTFRKCQKISRYLESFIDEEQWLGEKYTLDVSSPGIGKPLKMNRQYRINIGRRVEVFLLEGKPQTGKLIEVDNDSITIEYEITVKEGKKKRKEMTQQNILFENIKKTVVKVSF